MAQLLGVRGWQGDAGSWAFVGVVAAICLGRLSMGWAGFPVLDGDATCFMPNAVAFAGGHGLINTFWSRAAQVDALHQGRLVWHGFIMPMVIGGLMWRPTPSCMHQVMSVVDVATIISCAWSCWRLIGGKARWWQVAGAIAGILALANAQILVAGRPETMCMLLISLGWVAMRQCPGWAQPPVIGVILGCAACTDPAIAIIAALAIAVELLRRMPWRAALRAQGMVAGACVATIMLLASAMYPYGMATWIAGLSEHGGLLSNSHWSGSLSTSTLIGTWLGMPTMPLLAGVLVSASWIWLSLGMDGEGRTRIDRLLLGGTAALLLLAMSGFIFSRPQQLYYFLALMPILVALNMQRLAQPAAIAGQPPPAPRLMDYGALAALAIPALGLLVTALSFSDYCRFGMSLAEARERYAQWIGAKTGVAGSRSLWVLSDIPGSIRCCDPRDEERAFALSSDDRFFVLQQANLGQRHPRAIADYDCIYDGFSEHEPRIGILRYGNAVKSYAFALYARHGLVGSQSLGPRSAVPSPPAGGPAAAARIP